MKKFSIPNVYLLAAISVVPIQLFSLFLPPFGIVCGGMSVAIALYWDKGAFMSIKMSLFLGWITGFLGGIFQIFCVYLFLWFLPFLIDGVFGEIEYMSLSSYMDPRMGQTNYILIGNFCLTMINGSLGGWLCLRFLHSYRILPKEIDETWTQ